MLVLEIKLDRLMWIRRRGKNLEEDSEWGKNPEKADLKQYYSKINF